VADACEDFILNVLPERVDEDKAFELAKAFSSEALADKVLEVVGNVPPEKLVKAYFNLFEIIGKAYTYEIKSTKPLVVEIRNCPQRRKVRGRGSCAACLGLVAGVLERAYGSAAVEAFGKRWGPPDAAVVIKKEGEPGNCVWRIEERNQR